MNGAGALNGSMTRNTAICSTAFPVTGGIRAAGAELARRAGMKILGSNSQTSTKGFVFSTAFTPILNQPARPIGRDLVNDYLEAFRNEGVKAGLYYSLI